MTGMRCVTLAGLENSPEILSIGRLDHAPNPFATLVIRMPYRFEQFERFEFEIVRLCQRLQSLCLGRMDKPAVRLRASPYT